MADTTGMAALLRRVAAQVDEQTGRLGRQVGLAQWHGTAAGAFRARMRERLAAAAQGAQRLREGAAALEEFAAREAAAGSADGVGRGLGQAPGQGAGPDTGTGAAARVPAQGRSPEVRG